MLFRDILLRLRDARLTISDFEQLMKQTPAKVSDLAPFTNALHLHPTVEAVVEHNVARLHASGHPVATIKAIHAGPNASKASSEDAGGWSPSSALHAMLMSCSLQTSGWIWNSSMVPWELSLPSVIVMENHLPTCQLQSQYNLTPTEDLNCLMELFLLLHFAAPGLHQVVHVHVYNSLSS